MLSVLSPPDQHDHLPLPPTVWISAYQQIGATSSRERVEKIISCWWPLSLPPPSLWFTSTVSAAKSAFYLKISSSASKLFSVFSSPLTPPSSLTADDFATYFTTKVDDINTSFTPMPIQKASPPTLTSDGLTCFSPLSSKDVHRLGMSKRAALTRFLPPFSSWHSSPPWSTPPSHQVSL